MQKEEKENYNKNKKEMPQKPQKKPVSYVKFREPEPICPDSPTYIGSVGYAVLILLGVFFLVAFALGVGVLPDEKGEEIMSIAGAGTIIGSFVLAFPIWGVRNLLFNKKHNAYSSKYYEWSRRKDDFDKIEHKRKDEIEQREYSKRIDEYQDKCSKIEQENRRLEQACLQAIENYNTAIGFATAEIKAIKETLTVLYDANVIYPKYQWDIVAITMFCEYIDSGRCARLEGTNGAYNLYESESRANIIISKLDTVIGSLESIRQNQFYLFRSLSDVNVSVNRLSSGIDNQATLQAHHARLLADKADSLRAIEQNKLNELRALRQAVDN